MNITRITPVGSYALQLHFDDGHDTGIYSWGTLYALGKDQEKNWSDYLVRLANAGVRREQATQENASRPVRILYFVRFVEIAGHESEEMLLPQNVTDVRSLLQTLARRGEQWKALGERGVKVTVNKQFAGPDTPIKGGDEIALVPAPPA